MNNPVARFRVEQGEMWILYPGTNGEVKFGKAKSKRTSLFFKRQDRWVDKDGQDHNPHAYLQEGDSCELCQPKKRADNQVVGRVPPGSDGTLV